MMIRKPLQYPLAAILGALTLPLFAAEPTSVEDRLSQLEQTVQTLQKENTELKTQLGWDAKAKTLPVVVKAASASLLLPAAIVLIIILAAGGYMYRRKQKKAS